MIVDDRAPRWIQELARYVSVKNLLIVHGNVLDLLSFPSSDSQTGETQWVDGQSIVACLKRFLSGQGYEIVGLFDPLDGLQFDEEQMRSRYNKLASGSERRDTQSHARENNPGREGGDSRSAGGSQQGSAAANRSNDGDASGSALAVLPSVRQVLANRETPSVFVFNLASRLLGSPGHLSNKELALFTQVSRASLDAREVVRADGRWNNALIMVCDKPNDLPAFVYVNNPRTVSICIDRPEGSERRRFFTEMYGAFHSDTSKRGVVPDEHANQFAALTDGLTYYEMTSLVSLSRKERLDVQSLQPLVERYKYGITSSEWDSDGLAQRLKSAPETIRARVKGQDAAVSRTLDIVKRARLGLAAGASRKGQRPRGVLFFAGPTGVGKTEMAKALAEVLFRDEERLIRFDMSEYSTQHADQRLLGSPPGYVGYEEGGQLTTQVKENPFSVLLFDEIEKAHSSIFDKFLQVLDDGRLTDGRGETVYFSQCIIIFTSNLGTVRQDTASGTGREPLVTTENSYEEVRAQILEAIRNHFRYALERPEILNRFGDNFVVFDFIRPPLDEQIVDMLAAQLTDQLNGERNIRFALSDKARETLIELARDELGHGGRGIRNALDAALINPLARWLFDQNVERDASLELKRIIDHGQDASYRFELDMAT